MANSHFSRLYPKSGAAIPGGTISLSDAFVRFYESTTPNHETLQAEVDRAEAHRNGVFSPENDAPVFAAYRAQTLALGEAEIAFRNCIAAGELTAWIRDPRTGEKLQTNPRIEWSWPSTAWQPTGIYEDYVWQDDIQQPGPNTEHDGKVQPVFFMLSEFDEWLRQHEQGRGGSPVPEVTTLDAWPTWPKELPSGPRGVFWQIANLIWGKLGPPRSLSVRVITQRISDQVRDPSGKPSDKVIERMMKGE
jgi:hypothetical protein